MMTSVFDNNLLLIFMKCGSESSLKIPKHTNSLW